MNADNAITQIHIQQDPPEHIW